MGRWLRAACLIGTPCPLYTKSCQFCFCYHCPLRFFKRGALACLSPSYTNRRELRSCYQFRSIIFKGGALVGVAPHKQTGAKTVSSVVARQNFSKAAGRSHFETITAKGRKRSHSLPNWHALALIYKQARILFLLPPPPKIFQKRPIDRLRFAVAGRSCRRGPRAACRRRRSPYIQIVAIIGFDFLAEKNSRKRPIGVP